MITGVRGPVMAFRCGGRVEPINRFTGLAEVYARCRPDYPAEAVHYIVGTCGLGPGSLVVDVGCGTGISSRLFAGRGLRVIGVEPNADMRGQAEAEPAPSDGPAPTYRNGTAESTGLPDACAQAMVAAQAFHWFQPEPTLREFQRLLVPGGWVVLLWNERAETDPFTAAVGAVIRTAPDAARIEGPRRQAGEALFRCPLFHALPQRVFGHEQIVDEEGLL